MAEDKANQKPKYRFSVERLGKYMPADLNDKQAEEYVLNATQGDGSIVLTKPTYNGIINVGDYYAKTST